MSSVARSRRARRASARASIPLAPACSTTTAARARRYLMRASHMRTVRWMTVAAAWSLSVRILSSTAICPARKNTLVLPSWNPSRAAWRTTALANACSWPSW